MNREQPLVATQQRCVGALWFFLDKETLYPSFIPDFDQFSQQAKKIAHLPIKDFMTTRVYSVEENTSRTEAANLLFRKHLRIVTVVRSGKLVGILTPSSLFKNAMEEN